MSDIPFACITSTGAMVKVQWSDLGDATLRKQTFGGYINAWRATRVGDFVYVIPASVTAATITKALRASLAAHDRALLAYPHGRDARGAAAMRIKLFGKAADDLKAATKTPRAAGKARARPAPKQPTPAATTPQG